jgi:hypothetical protein
MGKRTLTAKDKQKIIKTVQEKISNVTKADIEKILKIAISVGTAVVTIAQTINKTINEINKNKKPLEEIRHEKRRAILTKKKKVK